MPTAGQTAPPPSVLIVEDDRDLRDALAGRLGDEGFPVRTAADGQEALAAIASARPDVVLLDLMMPNLDGWQLMQRMAASPELCTIPLLIITAARNVGSTPFKHPVFVKPLDMDALVHAIETLGPA